MATTSRRRPKVSAEQQTERDAQRVAKVEGLTEELHAAVINLADSDAWRAHLDVASKFHRYSWRNQVLLWLQAEERGITLSAVAGFNRWKELGGTVRRGEKGLAILAPLKRRLSAEEAAKLAAEAKRAYDSEGRPAMVVRGFRIEHVWDHSQTDAIPGAEQRPAAKLDQPAGQRTRGSLGSHPHPDRGRGLRDPAPAPGRQRQIGSWLERSRAARRMDS